VDFKKSDIRPLVENRIDMFGLEAYACPARQRGCDSWRV
jgi:hypothetical protein